MHQDATRVNARPVLHTSTRTVRATPPFFPPEKCSVRCQTAREYRRNSMRLQDCGIALGRAEDERSLPRRAGGPPLRYQPSAVQSWSWPNLPGEKLIEIELPIGSRWQVSGQPQKPDTSLSRERNGNAWLSHVKCSRTVCRSDSFTRPLRSKYAEMWC